MRKIIYGLVFTVLLLLSGIAFSAYPFYGPTSQNEHLYRIALMVRPAPQFSIQQVMLAILYANPAAFNQHNINGLKSGYRLIIPPPGAIAKIHPDFAARIVNEQNKLWLNGMVEKPKPVTYLAKKKHFAPKHHYVSKEPIDSIPSIENAIEERVGQPKNKKKHTAPVVTEQSKTTLMDIAKEQQERQGLVSQENSSIPENTNETELGNIQLPEPQDPQEIKVNKFIEETKKFEAQTTDQLASAQQQTKALEAKVTKLNEDLRTLTYHFVQLTTQNNPQPNYIKLLFENIKHNGIALIAGLLTFTLLTYFLIRSFRPSVRTPMGRQDYKKDEYDFMNSHESIPTKLDLARAYMDMGDDNAAETVLKEVIQKGNAEQAKDARDLLAKLNSSL